MERLTTPEVRPEAREVGEHLVDQVRNRNPLLVTFEDRFEAAAMTAQYTGNEDAFELSKQELFSSLASSNPADHIHPPYIGDLVEAELLWHGQPGVESAIEILDCMPNKNSLLKAEYLTQIAEVAESAGLRALLTHQAMQLIDHPAPSGDSYTLTKPYDLVLRLGIANQSPELIESAAARIQPLDYTYEFTEIIAQALQTDLANNEPVRQALVQAAIHDQQTGASNMLYVPRHHFDELLTEDELSKMLRAIIRRVWQCEYWND